jgi:hypothetical protein
MSAEIIDLSKRRLARQEASDPRLTALFAALRGAREVVLRSGSQKSWKKLDQCEILLRETYPAFANSRRNRN